MKVGRIEQLTTEPAIPKRLESKMKRITADFRAEQDRQRENQQIVDRVKAWLDSEDAECKKMRPGIAAMPYGIGAPVGYGIRVAVARTVRQIVEGK